MIGVYRNEISISHKKDIPYLVAECRILILMKALSQCVSPSIRISSKRIKYFMKKRGSIIYSMCKNNS